MQKEKFTTFHINSKSKNNSKHSYMTKLQVHTLVGKLNDH
jgi:hypothetical protein